MKLIIALSGPDIIVEVDESKFGKRNYHRGHPVEGCWVVGSVERTVERRVFAVIVEDRKAATLKEVIFAIYYLALWFIRIVGLDIAIRICLI